MKFIRVKTQIDERNSQTKLRSFRKNFQKNLTVFLRL